MNSTRLRYAGTDSEERRPSRTFWCRRRVLLTGGAGFLGSHVAELLGEARCARLYVVRSLEYDLTRLEAVRRLYGEIRPDLVIHLAARVGGILATRESPGQFFHENLLMGVHMIDEARRAGVEKFVQVGTIFAYPEHTPVPFREEDLWNGYPEETNAPYGIAKRALLVQLQAYRQQYGMHGIYLLPVDLYGPGDSFDPATSDVIPALIRKMLEAIEVGRAEVKISGSGNTSREFLYVRDCARGILLAAEHYDAPEPVNLGTGEEVRIRELALMIARAVGYEGELVFDAGKPEGQPRRCLDTRRARERFGFRARVPLREGLERTVKWYVGQRTSLAGQGSEVPA